MDVALINPNPSQRGLNLATMAPPIGLGYLASVLEGNGHRCSVIDAHLLGLSAPEIVAMIPPSASAVGIYLNSFSYDSVRELASAVRRFRPAAKIIIGGPLPSSAPELVLRDIPCDGLIRGEGERALLAVMDNLSRGREVFQGGVSGAAYLGRDRLPVLHPVERIRDLDSLPFPAYHLMPPLRRYHSRSRRRPAAPMVTSRGCAYDCTFCSKDVFRRVVTLRSPANVLAEVDHLVRDYGVRQIDIMDDNFAQDRQRLEEIVDGLIARDYGLAINIQNGIRTETLDEAVLKKMKRAGVYKLAFGIESADEELLRRHRKQVDLGRLEEVVKSARRLGLIVYAFIIIGLLGETEEGFERTLSFLKKLDFDAVNFCMAIPFPGTELHRMVAAEGRFLVDTARGLSAGYYDGTVFYEYGPYQAEDIRRRYRRAYREFYNPKKQLKILLDIRSWSEFVWLLGASWFIWKGVWKSLRRRPRPARS